MRVKQRLASADDARYWLSINVANRGLSGARVEALAGAMLRGEWVPNTDAIGVIGREFSPGARLGNGQHRAAALLNADAVQPGISIPLTVADELTDDEALLIDVGKSRSLEDALTYLGEAANVNVRQLAAAVMLAWHIDAGTYVPRQPTPTRVQQVDFLMTKAADLRAAVPIGARIARGMHVPASGIMAAVWLIGRGRHADRLDRFAAELTTGQGLTSADATYRLRELFAGWTASRNVDRGRPWRVCAMTVFAWNLMIEPPARLPTFARVRLPAIPPAL